MSSRRALVAVVGLLGFVSLLVGIGLRTIWLPADSVSATATVSEPGVYMTTAPGLLEARPGPVTVQATASGGGQVLLAVGQERDVQAYVEGQAGTVVDGFDTEDVEQLTTSAVAAAAPEPPPEGQPAPEQPALPDPAASDLWVQQSAGAGSATLEYDPAEGRWLLLAAGDGTSPAPDQLTLTWPQEVRTPWSTPLVVLGVLLLLAAAAVSALMVKRERDARPSQRRRGRGRVAAGPAGDDPVDDTDDTPYDDRAFEDTGYEDTAYQDTGYEDTGYQDTGYQDTGYQDTAYGDPYQGEYRDAGSSRGYRAEGDDRDGDAYRTGGESEPPDDGAFPWERGSRGTGDDVAGPRGRDDREEGGR